MNENGPFMTSASATPMSMSATDASPASTISPQIPKNAPRKSSVICCRKSSGTSTFSPRSGVSQPAPLAT